jgi:2-keto-4-pentenoate hydratase/2-oxohepta-3-ene-1,7-dioic acid hydratase in catechol pathway
VHPPNIRDFIAFETHIKNARAKRNSEVPAEWYNLPTYYRGTTSGIIGPDDEVRWPNYTNKLDYELELACIIGKGGENISKANAEDHIFGYTIMNDFSARDIQMREMSIGLGPAKGKDFATALGPYIITKEELGDPYNLKMEAYVNGELWSEGNTGSIYWKFPDMIEYASQSESLLPGDILGSGTVGFGCGLELDKFLKPNDVVELRIEKLGSLINKVVKNK